MVELDNIDAFKETAIELAMEVNDAKAEVEDAKAETEQALREFEAIRQTQLDERNDVRRARQRIAKAKRARKLAEENLAKEKRKTKELRREKKVKGDAIRFYKNQTMEARARSNGNRTEDIKKMERELEALRQHRNTLSR